MGLSPSLKSTAVFIVADCDDEARAYGSLLYRRCWELGLRNIECAEPASLAAALQDFACIVLTEGATARLSSDDVRAVAEWARGGGWLAVIAPPPDSALAEATGLAGPVRTVRRLPGQGLDFDALRAAEVAATGDSHSGEMYPVWGEALLGDVAETGRAVLEFVHPDCGSAVKLGHSGRGRILSYLFTLGYTVFRNQSGRGIEHLPYSEDRQRRELPPDTASMWDWCDDIVRYPTQSLAHPDWWQHPFSDGLIWPLLHFALQATGHPPLVYWVPEGRATCFINAADSDGADDGALLEYVREMQQRRIPATIFLQADLPHGIEAFPGIDRDLIRFGIHHSPREVPISEQFRILAGEGFEPVSSRGHGLQWHGVDTTASQLRAGGVRIDSTHGLCGTLGAPWYFFVDGTSAPHSLTATDGTAMDLLEVTIPFMCYYGQEQRPGEEFDLETYIAAFKRHHLVAAGAYHPVWNFREPRWSPMLNAMHRLSRDPEIWLTSMEDYLQWWDMQQRVVVVPKGDRWEVAGPSVPGLTLLSIDDDSGSGEQLSLFGHSCRAVTIQREGE